MTLNDLAQTVSHNKRLTQKGYDLERGIKGSDNKHIKIKEYKKMTKKLNQQLNVYDYCYSLNVL